jgi:hypothetical protein
MNKKENGAHDSIRHQGDNIMRHIKAVYKCNNNQNFFHQIFSPEGEHPKKNTRND